MSNVSSFCGSRPGSKARDARVSVLILAASCLLAPAGEAHAAAYEFTVVADTGRLPGFGALRGASIGNGGEVAFFGHRFTGPAVGHALMAYRDGAIVTLADTSDGVHQRVWSNADFNDRGEAAFAAEIFGVGEAIVVHDGAATRRLYSAPSPAFSYLREQPAFNNAGHVAFRSIPSLNPMVSGAYTGNGVTTRTVAEKSQPFGGVSRPDLNDAGQVAYREAGSPSDRIYVDTNGTRTLIADGAAMPYRAYLDDPALNDNGRVAFRASATSETNRFSGIYAGDGGALTTVVDSSGPLGSFGGYVGLNDAGQVAYIGWLDGGGFKTGGSGIYTGPDIVRDRVIAEGNLLDGSRVTRLSFYGGLNDAGQIAFEYDLANGRNGIALATPVPEPAACAAVTAAAVFTVVCGRRRWRARRCGPGEPRR